MGSQYFLMSQSKSPSPGSDETVRLGDVWFQYSCQFWSRTQLRPLWYVASWQRAILRIVYAMSQRPACPRGNKSMRYLNFFKCWFEGMSQACCALARMLIIHACQATAADLDLTCSMVDSFSFWFLCTYNSSQARQLCSMHVACMEGTWVNKIWKVFR